MTLFDFSTNPDRVPFTTVLRALNELARAAGGDVLLVGATARDLALAAEGHEGSLRATNDVDIAVAVADAASFKALVADLELARTGNPHKFLVHGIEVDIVPFGGVDVRRSLSVAVATRCAELIKEDRSGRDRLGLAMRGDTTENVLLLDAFVAGALLPDRHL